MFAIYTTEQAHGPARVRVSGLPLAVRVVLLLNSSYKETRELPLLLSYSFASSRSWRHLKGALSSEKVCFSHDSVELIFADLAITIAVGLIDHLLNFVVSHVFSELLGNALQVLERDFACLIIVEEAESLHHLLFGVALSHLGGHHIQEFVVVDDARAVLVDVSDHLLDLFALGLEAEGTHSDLQFLLVDVAAAVGVEEVEGLLDLLLLLLSKLSRLLGALNRGLLVGLLVVRSLSNKSTIGAKVRLATYHCAKKI